MNAYNAELSNRSSIAENAINSGFYINYAYQNPLLTEKHEKRLCRQMEKHLVHFLAYFSNHPELLEQLKDFLLQLEGEANIQKRRFIGRRNPNELNLLGTIDELELQYYLGDQIKVHQFKNRLKSKIFRWSPPSFAVVKLLLAQPATLNSLPTTLKGNLSRLKSRFFETRNKMIVSNMRLVMSIASKYKSLGVPYDDLIQEGNLALIKAIEHFDFERGYRFSTYAYRIINQNIQFEVDRNSHIVRRPYQMIRDKKTVEKIRQRLEQSRGAPATLKQVENELGTKLDNLQEIMRTSSAISADTLPESYSGKDPAFEIPDQGQIQPEEATSQDKLFATLTLALSEKSERERLILKMKFGIGLRKEYTLDEIGDYFGLSRERIRQIYLRFMDDLKEILGNSPA